jgi:hypothetical protein
MYRPVETTDGKDGKTVPGTHYRVISDNLIATGSEAMCIHENSDLPNGAKGDNATLSYRRKQNGRQFFVTNLEWCGRPRSGIANDDPR